MRRFIRSVRVKASRPTHHVRRMSRNVGATGTASADTSGGPGKRRQALAALRKHSTLSVAELETLWQQWERRTGGKSMNLEQFTESLALLGIPVTRVDDYFRVFDSDRSGTIEFPEFATTMAVLTKGSLSDKLEFMFKVWDSDEDGLISRDEYNRWVRSSALGNHTLANQIWADIDLDNDGYLSMEEMKKGLLKFQLVAPNLPFGSEPALKTTLSDPEHQVIALIGEHHYVEKGHVLSTRGSLNESLWLLVEGKIELRRDGVVVQQVVDPGSSLTEESLMQCPSLTEAVAVVKSHVIQIRVADLLPLIYHDHKAAVALVERVGTSMMRRLKLLEDQIHSVDGLDPKLKQAFSTEQAAIARAYSLSFHSLGVNGKLEIRATKQVGSAEALSVAYSPGVAETCLAIKEKPDSAYEYTSKGHLVGCISNGTAVLGLGNIGAAASKPVMEGKAVLFKKFGGVDCFDIELNADPKAFVEHCVALEPTFGGINIEDVKAPECFWVEKEVQRRMNIPVMHDDQHGTAIIAGAGLLNALELVNKRIQDVRVVVCGVGAAGFTCARYFRSLGVQAANLICVDKDGVVFEGRSDLADDNAYLTEVATTSSLRTLPEVLEGADVFLGVSAGGLLKPEMLASMATDPLVFALANPTPEISFHVARSVRKDVIMATGRSDFPNQINNVCAFPYIFRGALDCRATAINEAIKQAASAAIARIPKEYDAEIGDEFGRDYIIPRPFDRRLLYYVAPAVAEAAMASGLARFNLDLDEYRDKLRQEAMRRM